MREIALYNLLKRIPDATDEEVKEVVADVASAKEVATKSDLDMGLAKLEIRLVKQLYGAVGVVLVGVGLMIKFL